MHFTIFSARETELIQGCRRGNRHAQQRLFDLYSGRMNGISLRYVKDPMLAEDVVVMAFTKIFDRIDQFRGDGSFEGWMRRIVVNEALAHLRRTRMMMAETDLEEADRQPDYDKLSDSLEAEDLLRIIARLPPGYSVVFNMYAIDGYSHKEIAQALGITENTSKSQLSRARAHLQKLLADADRADTKSQQP